MQMAIIILANGSMIRLKGMVSTDISMVLNTKACGKMINSMVMALRHGRMVPNTRVVTLTARNTAMVI